MSVFLSLKKILFVIDRYFERSNGYLRLPNTNWVLFWHGRNGYRHVDEYSKIATRIPASFLPPPQQG